MTVAPPKPTLVAGRRAALAAALALPALLAGRDAWAQGTESWPNRPLRMGVPFPPGGTTDLLARLMADGVGQRIGQTIVVENRGGAGGAVGAEMAARMDPDGYNLFFATIGSAAITIHLLPRINWKPEDLVPVALFADVPNVIVVRPDSPWRNLQDMLRDARAKPGDLTFASSGTGSSLHLSGEMLKAMAGVDILHVPFRGGADTVNQILAGRVDMSFNNLPSAISLVRGGQLRALAVTSPERAAALPEVPTVAESGIPGYAATAWFGLQVPRGTPQPVIDRLNRELNATLNDPTTRSRIENVGARPRGGSAAEFAAYIESENKVWADIIRRSGAKAD